VLNRSRHIFIIWRCRVNKFTDYFLLRGIFATCLSASVILLFVWSNTPWLNLDASNVLLTLLVVGAVYVTIAFALGELNVLAKISNESQLYLCMVALAFVSIEMFNILIVTVQGGTYLPDPQFQKTFLFNKVINLIVTLCSVALVFWLSPPEK